MARFKLSEFDFSPQTDFSAAGNYKPETMFTPQMFNPAFSGQTASPARQDNRRYQASNSGDSSAPYERLLRSAAQQHGVPYEVLKGVIGVESSFNPGALPPLDPMTGKRKSSAKGIAQLIDSTAKELGVTDPFNPDQAIPGAARYLRQNMDKFGGDIIKAVSAYNIGPGAVSQSGVTNPDYVRKVLGEAANIPVAAPFSAATGMPLNEGLREQHARLAKMGLEEREDMLAAMPTGSRPIHAIRGNKESWYNPGQGREFGTFAEATTGYTGGPSFASEETRRVTTEQSAQESRQKIAEETNKSNLEVGRAREITAMTQALNPYTAGSMEELLASEDSNKEASTAPQKVNEEEGGLWKWIKDLQKKREKMEYDENNLW